MKTRKPKEKRSREKTTKEKTETEQDEDTKKIIFESPNLTCKN